MIARTTDGDEICGPCAGLPGAYICPGCGTGGRLYADGCCPRCVLKVRLDQHLAGPDGQVNAQLRPLLQAMASAENARTVLNWLKHSPNARLLAELAASGQAITHELLDELPPGRHEHYVRQALVAAGVLPERREDLDRIPAWLNTLLVDRPVEHARLVRPYVHWFLLKRARRRAERRRHPAHTGAFLRTWIRIALELLTWLDDHDGSLATLTQADLDRWLAAGNTRNHTIRYFLGWAADRGIAPRLTIPPIPRQDPARILDEQEHWGQFQRCLADTALPLDVRVAGALLLLFGLPISRIRLLRAEHLQDRDDGTYLDIGRHPLLIPPRLAVLLRELAATPVNRSNMAVSVTWLFPGLVPGQPASSSAFGRKICEHGIEARPARNAALIALVEDVPAPVMADILGLHISTAVRWADIAKRDWSAYLAARAEDLQRGNTAPSE
ncbi:hypothetical protein ABGB14_48155 [Nonomuraea sp. B10E15]|uniref:hypothetical protein n=1 Tax=Nonomuraea sp. B10E15 TaxID=3153560 RepID=UPI00325DE631